MEEKKQWERPRLIILGRGKPEESVLGQCKQKTISGGTVLLDPSALRMVRVGPVRGWGSRRKIGQR